MYPSDTAVDTPIPIPEKIREMHRLYQHGDVSLRQKSLNFYRQGKFMENYEDDAPWNGNIQRYFPTYHDLTLRELRGYFTWRSAVRRGEFGKTSDALAYIYIYELLNRIGVVSVQDSLQKLREFEMGYLDAGLGGESMRSNLRKWMLELAVLNGLRPEEIRAYEHPVTLAREEAMTVLRHPREHGDQEVLDALVVFTGSKVTSSVVLRKHREDGTHLFAEVWRVALEQYSKDGEDLFSLCFGRKQTYRWYPLGNAVYYEKLSPDPVPCVLNECREYFCDNGIWYQTIYPRLTYNEKNLKGLLRETDRKLRLYLDTGHALKAQVEELWADSYIDAVIEADRQARIEAARPKVNIEFGALEQIRQDASVTRDSLLTEAELRESIAAPESPAEPMVSAEHGESAEPAAAVEHGGTDVGATPVISLTPTEEPEALDDAPAPALAPAVPLSPFQISLLAMLLDGQPTAELINAEHAMPEIVADEVNEALFEEIGDTALECEDGRIAIIEDYREDVARIVYGGTE